MKNKLNRIQKEEEEEKTTLENKDELNLKLRKVAYLF
jgi:hypothetical protein